MVNILCWNYALKSLILCFVCPHLPVWMVRLLRTNQRLITVPCEHKWCDMIEIDVSRIWVLWLTVALIIANSCSTILPVTREITRTGCCFQRMWLHLWQGALEGGKVWEIQACSWVINPCSNCTCKRDTPMCTSKSVSWVSRWTERQRNSRLYTWCRKRGSVLSTAIPWLQSHEQQSTAVSGSESRPCAQEHSRNSSDEQGLHSTRIAPRLCNRFAWTFTQHAGVLMRVLVGCNTYNSTMLQLRSQRKLAQ